MINRILCLLFGYVCGNLLTAEFVSKHQSGKSAFTVGTGNPGMANIVKQYGIGCGAATLAGDIAKTILSCLLCRLLIFPELGVSAAAWAGLGCTLGHNYPLWHHLKGGKGVACTCTALVLISPLWGLISCIAGLVAVLITGYLPIGAVIIPLFFLFPAFLVYGAEIGVIASAMTILMISRHYSGLKNIPTGTEHKVNLLKYLKRE